MAQGWPFKSQTRQWHSPFIPTHTCYYYYLPCKVEVRLRMCSFFPPSPVTSYKIQLRHDESLLSLLDASTLRHLLTTTINYHDTWIWDIKFSHLHTGKPIEDLLSATKGNKLSCECYPVPCRSTSACPRPGQPGSFPCCLRDNLSWHLLLGGHPLLFGDNQPLQPIPDTPVKAKRNAGPTKHSWSWHNRSWQPCAEGREEMNLARSHTANAPVSPAPK